jgi:hypothetical protein
MMYASSLNDIDKILYVGAGLHISPVEDFSSVSEFVFVDTQPRSEYDRTQFYPENYRKDFVKLLKIECLKYGMRFVKKTRLDGGYKRQILSFSQKIRYLWSPPKFINPYILWFYNEDTGQTLKYYVSTNIEYNMCAELKRDVEESKALIVSRYSPKTKLLDYFGNVKIFIGYSDSCMTVDLCDVLYDKNRSHILYMLNTSQELVRSQFFYKYFLVVSNRGVKIECNHFEELLEQSNIYSK